MDFLLMIGLKYVFYMAMMFLIVNAMKKFGVLLVK